MSAPSENMPIAVSVPRSKPLLLRHLPYFIGAAVLVTLAATMQFDGYIHNILMQATTFAIAVFGLSVVLGRVCADGTFDETTAKKENCMWYKKPS